LLPKKVNKNKRNQKTVGIIFVLIPVLNQLREQRGVDKQIEKDHHRSLKKKDETGLEAQITTSEDVQVSLPSTALSGAVLLSSGEVVLVSWTHRYRVLTSLKRCVMPEA